jgi:phosphinothricin acetyltransferase
MTLRDARESDLARVVAIYNETVPGRMATADLEPVTVEQRRSWFDAHTSDRPIWVLESEGTVAAWLSFQAFYGRAAYARTAEVSVYVAAARRRQGLGRRLLAEAVRRSPDLGLQTLLGFVFAHNEPSLRLFEGTGFRRWGLLPGVAELDGVKRDLVLLGRPLVG